MLFILVILGCLVVLVLLFLAIWGFKRTHKNTATMKDSRDQAAEKKQVALILNPIKCDASQVLETVKKVCRDNNLLEPLYYETTVADPGYQVADEAISAGAEVILVGGGDGTVRAVSSRLLNKHIILGILPVGTGNLLARNLNIYPNKFSDCLKYALFGEERHIDVGRIFLKSEVTKQVSTDIFLVMAGFGFDADVISKTSTSLKKTIGWMAYMDAGVRHLPGKRNKVTVKIDNLPASNVKTRTIIVGNCSILPTGINLFSNALIDDGKLDVMTVSPRNSFEWIFVFGEILFKRPKRKPLVKYHKAKNVELKAHDTLEVQVDGDSIGSSKFLRMQIVPDGLVVRVPPRKLSKS